MPEIFAVLNTHLDQFADSVSNIQVEDFFLRKKVEDLCGRNKSRCNQLTYRLPKL